LIGPCGSTFVSFCSFLLGQLPERLKLLGLVLLIHRLIEVIVTLFSILLAHCI
jgi:hypothetical protein